MKNKKSLILLSLIFFTSCYVKIPETQTKISSSPTSSTNSEQSFIGDLDFRKVLSGEKSNVKKFSTRVVTNETELQTLWNDYTGNFNNPVFLPKIDFQQKNVIAIFLGDKPTNNYAVDIDKITESKDKISVVLREVKPTTGSEVNYETTQPFLFIEIKKSNKYIEFDTKYLSLKNNLERLSFTKIEEGNDTGIKNISKIVVKTSDELFDFYKKHLSEKQVLNYKEIPKIDLKNNTLIGVFLGQRTSTRNFVEVSEVLKNNDFITIKAKEYLNGETDKTTKIYPYQIISIPKTTLPINFELTVLSSQDIDKNNEIKSTYKEIIFKPLATGNYSNIKQENYFNINNQEEFIRIWQQHSTNSIPNIDFSLNNVITAFSGEKDSTGYFIKIKSIIENEKDIRVFTELVNNQKDSLSTKSYPFDFVTIPKTIKPVIFIKNFVEN
ncbi:MAG: protease complex subunit PrcB family protein [Candidatus Sericytochromatia bacterium]